jgi:c-di-GMP-binding flagellar brake protein YcgR
MIPDRRIPERRKHPRFTARIPVEVHADGNETPIRCATSDISAGGCYIESMYPFPVGTCLELKLQISDTLLILGKVVTCHPQVGNGIEFIKILPEDRATLSDFLNSVAHQEYAESTRQ